MLPDTTSVLPDFGSLSKAPKIRAPKHDFKNGEGRVFAHRHSNGGGWVADTAYVAESVKVGSGCGVYGVARVTDAVELTGKAMIGGHARVMHNVKLAKNAHVRGAAIVRDNARLADDAVVAGRAQVSGNTFLQGHVNISDAAIVHNTSCHGPNSAYFLEISRNAKVLESTIHGPSCVTDDALLQNAHVQYSVCRDACKIINTQLSTTVDSVVAMWSFRPRRRRSGAELNPDQAPPLVNHRITVSGIMINSRLIARPCVIPPLAYMLNCQLVLYHQEMSAVFPSFPDGPLVNMSTNSLQRLIEHYAGPAVTAPIPPIAAVGVVPHFDQVRQRRIMRMEEQT